MIKKLQQQLLGKINQLKDKEQKGTDDQSPEEIDDKPNDDKDPAETPKQ